MPGIYNPGGGGGAPTGPAGGDLGGTYPNPTVDNAANIPSGDEKAALAGTSGAPAAGNKYVTDADARNSNARTPATHDNSVHSAGLRSTMVTFSRTAVAGAGVQSIVGAGFQPTAAIIFASDDGTLLHSIGFLDDANVEAYIRTSGAGALFDTFGVNCVDVSGAADGMTATGAFTADGIDLTWTKAGNGLDISGAILFLR